jgi:hypothetical protein
MTSMTIELPTELARRLAPIQDRLTEIIELGLLQLESGPTLLHREVVDFLASGPTPGEIVAFRPSLTAEARVAELLDKNQAGVLRAGEEAELDEYQYLNHLLTLVKIQARRNLAA